MPVFSYHSHPEKWQLDTLGAYVWVLLDEKELHVFEPGQDERKERIWWPGKIDDSIQDAPLLVRIYGSDTTLKVHSPSERNILSYKDSLGYPRFLLPTFIPPPKFELDESIYASPRKKRKRDRGGIEARWSIAVVAMHAEKEAEQDSDHLPEVGEAFAYTHLQCISTSAVPPSTSASPSKNPKKGPRGKGNKRKFEGSEDERDDSGFSLHEEDQRIHDYEVDEELDIPGELTLARYTKGVTDYWPARIEAYLPPKSRKEKQGRYRVTYLDGKKKDIPRSWFFTMEEPGFQSCKLGKFDMPHLHRPHSPSPDPPSTDYTPSADEFQDLPLRVQFSYTKPILQADSIARAAGRRGKMSTLVSRWCLRDGHELKLGNDSRKADTLEGDVDAEPDVDDHGSTSSFMTLGSVAATEPYTISEGMDDLGTIEEESEAGLVPPQKGCKGYEQLSGVEKVDASITQILLWRSGSRNSIQLLSDEEEESFMRRRAEGKSKKKVGKERRKTAPINLSGRPKRNMNTPDYRE
ncbi:hypothetical protein BDQ17DRAFT_1342126 [Cyathus striatus]|nr:hypothetical protein BDQ17DRAFT_1342126 [Cyathus striatus]